MTTTPDLPTTVEAYLADLDRALASADPRERAETVAAVREHAVESLARHGSGDESARRVLDELGPVEAIAAEVTPAPTPAAPAARVEAVDVVLPLLAVVVWPLAPVTLVWAVVRMRAGVGNRALQWLTILLSAIPTLGGLLLLLLHRLSSVSAEGWFQAMTTVAG
ncbi:HAAS signaling domain-containing protein [Promicromonospora sp. NPDC050880]|uniref:HAAS signaling domain-containing protein n=1 Tax=Promicromonospora sp. NPDC050880 TaxID=3364406 RepID=UPI0037AF63EE